jgi:hypothetical protein
LPPERNPGGDAHIARACVFALAADAARRDARLPEALRAPLAERYVALAQREMEAARREGYFEDRFKVEFVNGEPDLEALRTPETRLDRGRR